MADLTATADQFRRAVLANDQQASTELIRAYGRTYDAIRRQTDALLAKLRAAEAAGEPLRPSWLYEQQRLAQLQAQVVAEFARFSEFADATVTGQQAAAATLGEHSARALLAAAYATDPTGLIAATFNRLPTGALQELVGTLQDGSPLAELFDTFGPEASAQVKAALVTGLATGQGPQQIAYALRHSLGGDLTRALTVSRTEILRSYRSAALETYKQNSDVVSGWYWLASMSSRSCGFCLSMSGTFHPLDEAFASHPRCRCSCTPSVKTYKELGIKTTAKEPASLVPDGAAWFDRQDAATQTEILGPKKQALYADGTIQLSDLRSFRTDPRWGPTGHEASIPEALANAAARTKAAPAPKAAPTVAQQVRSVENEIRNNRGAETVVVFDPKGRIILDKRQAGAGVDVTEAEFQAIAGKDAIITHNHPLGWDFPEGHPEHGGNSFSKADAKMAADAGAAEIRAVSPGWRFSMRPPDGGWDETYFRETMMPAITKHEGAIRGKFSAAISQGTLTTSEASARHYHELWTRVSKELGLDYRREPFKP